jgi:hypothetical protein
MRPEAAKLVESWSGFVNTAATRSPRSRSARTVTLPPRSSRSWHEGARFSRIARSIRHCCAWLLMVWWLASEEAVSASSRRPDLRPIRSRRYEPPRRSGVNPRPDFRSSLRRRRRVSRCRAPELSARSVIAGQMYTWVDPAHAHVWRCWRSPQHQDARGPPRPGPGSHLGIPPCNRHLAVAALSRVHTGVTGIPRCRAASVGPRVWPYAVGYGAS